MTNFLFRAVRLSLALAGPFTLLGIAAPARAGSADVAVLQSASADLQVYAYYCAPDFTADIGAHPAPDSIQLAMASSSLRIVYGGDCRAYYLGRIAPLVKDLVPGVMAATSK